MPTPPEPIKCQAPAESSQHPAILGMTRHPGFSEGSRVQRFWALGSGVALQGPCPDCHTHCGWGRATATCSQGAGASGRGSLPGCGPQLRAVSGAPHEAQCRGAQPPASRAPRPGPGSLASSPGLSLVGFPCRGPVLVGPAGICDHLPREGGCERASPRRGRGGVRVPQLLSWVPRDVGGSLALSPPGPGVSLTCGQWGVRPLW